MDGQDLREVGLHQLRKNIAFIPQSPFLLQGTIRENLDPFNELSDKEIEKIVKKAEAATKPVAKKAPEVEDDYKKESYEDFEKTNLYDFVAATGESKDKYSFQVWNKPSEFYNFAGSDVKREMTEVAVLGHKVVKEGGRQCGPFELFTVQYKAWIKEGRSMKKVLDSSKMADGKPISF